MSRCTNNAKDDFTVFCCTMLSCVVRFWLSFRAFYDCIKANCHCHFTWISPQGTITTKNKDKIIIILRKLLLLARDAFVRTHHRAIAMMFVRLSACPSVRLSRTGVHCDHTVYFSADLSLWLDSPMFWASWHESMSTYAQPSFSSSTWKRGGVWMCKLGEKLNANYDKYVVRRWI